MGSCEGIRTLSVAIYSSFPRSLSAFPRFPPFPTLSFCWQMVIRSLWRPPGLSLRHLGFVDTKAQRSQLKQFTKQSVEVGQRGRRRINELINE